MTTPKEGPRSFSVFLNTLADGDAHTDLSMELHELTKALQEHAQKTGAVAKGELTVKFKFAVDARDAAAITYHVSSKRPEPTRAGSVFFVTKGGNLTVEHPRQTKLPLAEVPAPSAVEAPKGDREIANI